MMAALQFKDNLCSQIQNMHDHLVFQAEWHGMLRYNTIMARCCHISIFALHWGTVYHCQSHPIPTHTMALP
jgi:hypothetical protein